MTRVRTLFLLIAFLVAAAPPYAAAQSASQPRAQDDPDRDINGMTATVAAKLVRELCAYACGRA